MTDNKFNQRTDRIYNRLTDHIKTIKSKEEVVYLMDMLMRVSILSVVTAANQDRQSSLEGIDAVCKDLKSNTKTFFDELEGKS